MRGRRLAMDGEAQEAVHVSPSSYSGKTGTSERIPKVVHYWLLNVNSEGDVT